jgi:parallel beta helix pectate lyase-like protein
VAARSDESRAAPCRVAGILAVIAAVLLASAASAQAQTYTVTNLTDSGVAGDGSLRGEVKAANSNPGADTITFAAGLSGTITISGSGLVVQGPTAIEGPGPTAMTVRQISGGHRVIQVKLTEPGAVSISGLALAGGETTGPGGDLEYDGEGEAATLTLADCLITEGSAADYGGGIASFGAPLTLRGSVVSENEADSGGGIWAGGDGTPFTIEGSTIADNESSTVAGGLNGEVEGGGHDSIVRSTISGNHSGGAGGGAYLSMGTGTSLTIADSTLTENVADGAGGGLEVSPAGEFQAATIEDSTIARNHAGGLLGEAGGVQTFGFTPQVLLDSIVAENTGGEADIYGPWAAAFSLIGDLADPRVTESVPGSDLVGVDPRLGPLAANGGPSETMAPAANSPVVNKGGGALTTDQRGDPRPVIYPGVGLSAAPGANGADIGAVELQAPPTSPAPPSPPPPATSRPRAPRVRVNCPKSAGAGGCRFALQVYSSKPHRSHRKGKQARAGKPVAESAVARVKVKAGKSALVTLRPKPKFATKLEAAKSLLVREVETIAGATHTSYPRLKVVG